jgi:hypothetical protein
VFDRAPTGIGREKRVLGVFVFMIGAGCVLDIQACWLGAFVMLCGAAGFVWGMIEGHVQRGVSAASSVTRGRSGVAACGDPAGSRPAEETASAGSSAASMEGNG